MTTIFARLVGVPLLVGSAIFSGVPAQAAETVNIYSYRQPQLIQPLLDAFEAETGIGTRVLFAKSGLNERVQAEGANSPADLILTTDVGRLADAAALDIVQPVDSPALELAIPAAYRDPEGRWFGLTKRARALYVAKDRVDVDNFDYADLADPKWRGRICTRSGQHDYSIGLIAALVAHWGEDATRQWLEGVRDNLARRPTGGDRDQVKAIHAGLCDIALGNTYYMGKMLTNDKEPEQKDWAASVRLVFPTIGENGTHVNISGMALAKNAPHREAAIKLMDFLASPKAQEIYAGVNFEYPVDPDVPADPLVAGWGDFEADDLNLAEVARHRKTASELVEETGFDQGPNS